MGNLVEGMTEGFKVVEETGGLGEGSTVVLVEGRREGVKVDVEDIEGVNEGTVEGGREGSDVREGEGERVGHLVEGITEGFKVVEETVGVGEGSKVGTIEGGHVDGTREGSNVVEVDEGDFDQKGAREG